MMPSRWDEVQANIDLQRVTAERDTANARAERAEKALEGAVEALRDLTGRAESFWALLQGDYGVKISSEDQEDHNVYEFFFAIERAKAIYFKEKEEK